MIENDEFETISSRELKPAQRARLARVVQYVRDRHASNGVTSIRFKIDRCKYFASVKLTTRRSDCGRYSPRALLCDWDLFFFIGPRGGLTIKRAEFGFGYNGAPHLRKMFHCK